MTEIRTLPVHAVVRHVYPRPTTEKDELAMAVGKAIDAALSRFSYEARRGYRLTQRAMQTRAAEFLDDELATAGVEAAQVDRASILAEFEGMIRAFRSSVLYGLSRPRTRVILIGSEVGVYAQPDFWDGASRFFELKSYLAIPPPPDVAMQVELFQLAFPRFESILVCIDRHARPVQTTLAVVPRPSPARVQELLRTAYDLARATGEPKVREYVDGPFIPYAVPPPAPPSADERPPPADG